MAFNGGTVCGGGIAITTARKTRNRSQEQSCASVVCLVIESGDRDSGGGGVIDGPTSVSVVRLAGLLQGKLHM